MSVGTSTPTTLLVASERRSQEADLSQANPPPIVRSAVAGIDWPGIPSALAARMLALLHQFERSQWWPPAEIERHQFRQLERLAAHAVRTVPWYADRSRYGALFEPGPITVERWRRVPILTRADVQSAGDRLHSRAVPAAHGQVIRAATSGSTGQPVKLLKTPMSQLFGQASQLRHHLWHRHDLTASLAVITRDYSGHARYPEGRRYEAWRGPEAVVYRTGPAFELDIHSSIAEQAEWLQRLAPRHLLTYPSNLLFLGRHCLEHGIRLPSLAAISTLGEVVGAEVRAVCRMAFGLGLDDQYGAVDAGAIASQCPDYAHHHVQAQNLYLEVVNATGEPCRLGETGRIVATPLHNFAMPLIRYALGDHGELGGPCACGRGLPVLRQILGRTRNMVTLPSGELRWATLESERFAAIEPLRQIQTVQKSIEQLEARVVAQRPLTAVEEAKLKGLICVALGHDFTVTIAYRDAIPRSASGKFEEFLSEMAS